MEKVTLQDISEIQSILMPGILLVGIQMSGILLVGILMSGILLVGILLSSIPLDGILLVVILQDINGPLKFESPVWKKKYHLKEYHKLNTI